MARYHHQNHHPLDQREKGQPDWFKLLVALLVVVGLPVGLILLGSGVVSLFRGSK